MIDFSKIKAEPYISVNPNGRVPAIEDPNTGLCPNINGSVWFTKSHHEQLPSAKERYVKEVERVISVIELHLSRTKQEYLVGSKASYADLMFLPWSAVAGLFDPEKKWDDKYPLYKKWLDALNARPAVKKTFEEKAKAAAAASH
ncbi:Hypothetical protein R9X50_00324300 [Acrodontium crateriforme]|uniref:GST C-terminal domain-containing protein n=1 Tax=Acrodontium crateriforme TaxID=150365 RepID=A0AAQ3M5T9_9PEZI|nr:Hypothetical protein R9X50_00324300 [Acrodontium crateriforme]